MDKTLTLTGVVTQISFAYPHVQLYFDVTDENGNVQHWGSELGPTPLMLKNMNIGWTRDSIKPGDKVTITCHPHNKAGSTACLGRDPLYINGKQMLLNR